MASPRDLSSTPRSPDLSRPSPSWHSRTSEPLSGSRQYQRSPSHFELMPREGTHDSSPDVNAKLTSSPLGSRAPRLPTLSPGPHPFSNTPPNSAISHQPYLPYLGENVRLQELLSDPSASSHSGPSPYPGPSASPPGSLGSFQLSRSFSRYAAINQSSARPRTSSNTVFNNISDLASHYGIPQSLPRAPRTTPRSQPESESTLQSLDDFSAPEFSSLCRNYLNMLSQQPGDNTAHGVQTDPAPTAPLSDVTEAEAIQSLMEVLNATPDLQTSNDLNEFLTSPLLDSPMDDELLATPAIGSADMGAEILTSPLLEDYSGDSLEFPPLFDDFSQTIYQQPKPQQELTALPEFDIMYKISPTTPFIDSPSSPFENGIHMPSSSRRKTNATGTRKNVTPESLVPIDAPTQPRKYLTPSATSRKTVPAVWQRKRSRRSAFGDEEEDELGEEQRPSLSEQEAIEAKRRQNTIAARRSRKRKLEYQRELEESVEQYKRESEAWKMRAQTYFALLRSHQIPVPDLGPDP